MWHVYIIQNVTGIYYCGVTTDLVHRLEQHNGTKSGGAKTTRRGRPWKMVKHIVTETLSDALILEAKIKKAKKSDKISTLESYRK